MKVRLLKAMCFSAQRHEPDTEIDVSDSLARELIAQGRAAPADAANVAPPAGPMTIETAGALVSEPAAKGKAHARS